MRVLAAVGEVRLDRGLARCDHSEPASAINFPETVG